MKNKIFILLILAFSFQTFAQDFISEDEETNEKNTKPTFWERTYWGGEFGLMFGSATSIVISPEMGYVLTKNLSVGGGIIFQYYKDNYSYYESTIYGGKVFSRFFIWKDLYAIGILEVVNLDQYNPYYNQNKDRYWFASPLIGGGYMQRFSEKGGVAVSLLFNLNNDINSPYYGQAMPIIRIGFSI